MKELLNQLRALVALQAQTTEGPWAHVTDEYDGTQVFVDEYGTGRRPNPVMIVASEMSQGHDNGANDATFFCAAKHFDLAALLAYVEGLSGTLDSANDTNRVLVERLRGYDAQATAANAPTDDQLRLWLADATAEGCQSWCSQAVPALVAEVRRQRVEGNTLALALLGVAGERAAPSATTDAVYFVKHAAGLKRNYPALPTGYTHDDVNSLLEWADIADEFLREAVERLAPATAHTLISGNSSVDLVAVALRAIAKWAAASSMASTDQEDAKVLADEMVAALASAPTPTALFRTVEDVAVWVAEQRKLADEAHTATLGDGDTPAALAAYDKWNKLDDLYLWLFENGYYHA